jgi:endoglucanase
MRQVFIFAFSLLLVSVTRAASMSDMPSDAMTLVSKINVGWNLGNTLEASKKGFNGVDQEISWGNPRTTQKMIDAVKAAGFNAVRLPVCWHPHITYTNGTVTIDPLWIKRVKAIIGYCQKDGMYVIMNTHHEIWLEAHALYKDSAEVYAEERALWKALAMTFSDYDEHLLFAGTNEVHINWDECTDDNAKVQNRFNQIFVDVVRATGGKNLYRNLVVQSYACNDVWGIKRLIVPKDRFKGRLLMEFHCYDPWEYAGKGTDEFWGLPYKKYGISSWGQEDYFKTLFETIKEKFVDKGYPVIMGECGAGRPAVKTNLKAANASRAYYLEYVISHAKAHGIVPFLWDNGNIGDGADSFGLFDRYHEMKQVDNFSIPAIMKGARTKYPF